MAKGKKPSGSNYTSKGTVGTNRKLTNTLRREARDRGEGEINKIRAFLAGKRVYFTIPNPNKNDTRARFIRVLGSDLYGDYRNFNKYSLT